MGLSSFMSNGLFLMFSVTMTRFETVGLTFPPRWENSVSQNRFSQYSSRERKVGFCGFSRELLPRQTLDPVTLKNGARNSGVVYIGRFPLKANTSMLPFFT